jgi:hypothetical protein
MKYEKITTALLKINMNVHRQPYSERRLNNRVNLPKKRKGAKTQQIISISIRMVDLRKALKEKYDGNLILQKQRNKTKSQPILKFKKILDFLIYQFKVIR